LNSANKIFEISAGSVSLIIDLSSGTPVILHWGQPLGAQDIDSQLGLAVSEPAPHGDFAVSVNPGIWRENSRGFLGRPAIQGHRSGQDWSAKFEITNHQVNQNSASITSKDEEAGLEVVVAFEFSESGVLLISQTVTNVGSGNYNLEDLTTWLPVPDHANEILDFTGRWIKERQPQRQQIQVGTWSREIREGRSSHDYTIVQMVMTPNADFQQGEIWSLGLLWSGNTRHLVERQPTGRTSFGAGELLQPGEVILEPGQSYQAPIVAAVYSDCGIDGVSDTTYRWLRSRQNHPTAYKPRPLTLNVWEAVYFNHDLDKLTALADLAKEVGVERFVLDDGWFGKRRDDTAGLGDWVVSPEVWPNGLGPLAAVLEQRGIEFGLWFEGEMVNPDSDLYRAHPEWIFKVGNRIPPESRFQQVLDLTHPGAYQHVLTQVSEVLNSCKISYIKWDHNRVLTEAAHLGRAAIREQTKAIYKLFDELKARFPGLEIESCSSGGGRIDLGMAMHVDRFWTSDCNDALERQFIQRFTQIAIPPEMLGSHIGPTTSHTTKRTHDISFRAISALFGHAGIEWDLTSATADEIAFLKTWAAYYKANRTLLHSGRMTRVETRDKECFVQGVVSTDRSRAIFSYALLATLRGSKPSAVRVTGLDNNAKYKVRLAKEFGEPRVIQQDAPGWLDGVVMTGAALAHVGLRPPILAPENAIVIEIDRV
jgi:alpha-galactosidase